MMTNLRLKLLGFIALAALGCEAPDARLNPGDAIDVHMPVGAYERALDGIASLNEAFPALKLRAGTPGDWAVKDGYADGRTAFTWDKHPETVIDLENLRGLGPEWISIMVAHELVHALGLKGHLPAGLMAVPIDADTACIDAATVEALCAERPLICRDAHATCLEGT